MRTLVLVLAAVSLTACANEPVFTEMTDSTFVQTMVALRKLPVGSFDTATRARQRDSILRTFGVTAAQVESTAVRLANDPATAHLIWLSIENQTRRTVP